MSLFQKPVYFSQFDSETEQGSRYRVGIEKPVYYILKLKAKKDRALKGFQQNYDLYREYPNNLYKIDDSKIADWLNKALTKAVITQSNSNYYETLSASGHFSSPEYKRWKRASRGML